jgi:putative peptidoglycan lipid II flippase
MLPRVGFHFEWAFDWRDPHVTRVFRLMLPVTIGLGVINFDLLINSSLGTLVSEQAPRAIDAAFRIYMLPQGMFSVALATVLFPTLSRFAAMHDLPGLRRTMASGARQIYLLLIPAAVFTAVLATPIVRLVYERGDFGAHSTELVSSALFWFSFSLPFAGVNLLLTRTFFSLQRPWIPTALAVGNMAIDVAVSVALYKPLGIPGLVLGTVAGNVAMTLGQTWRLRDLLHGSLEGRRTLIAVVQMCAASALLGIVSYGVWWGLDQALGRSLLAQIVAVGAALAAGVAVYVGTVLALRISEAQQIRALLAGRFRRSA